MSGPSLVELLVSFLAARLAEDLEGATLAHAIDPGPWYESVDYGSSYTNQRERTAGVGLVYAADNVALWDRESSCTLSMTAATSVHVARHDPLRVIADVNAKLRLVDAYLTTKAEQDAIATRMTDALTAGDVPAREDAGLWRKTEARLEALEFPLMLAALPYWDHLEYDERWKP